MNQSMLQSAWQAQGSGNLNEAARLYREILRLDPFHFDALFGLGTLYYHRGELIESERLIARAIERNPNAPVPWFTHGCVLRKLDRPSEALAAFDKALSIRPAYLEASINKGGMLMGLRRYSEALASFDAALSINPNMPEAWNNRGNALCELGRYAEAVPSFERALGLRPQAVEVLVNRGTALIGLRRYADAYQSYDAAIRAGLKNARAFAGRGNALFEMKRHDEAVRDYAAALDLDPDFEYARGNLAYCRLHCCDWSHIQEDRAAIAAGLAVRKRVVNPFEAFALKGSEEDLRRCAAIWTSDKVPSSLFGPKTRERYSHDRIRIAYLSTDFGPHAVSTLIAGVLERHDREKFETIAVSLSGNEPSPMRSRLERAFGHFIEAGAKTDSETAAMLREMEIDIAVDLMGFTGECRPGILASRPAPIQVNYLGFPGTMAAPHIDYIIADRHVIPEESRRHYAEAVAYLPNSYLPNDSTRPIAQRIPSRTEAGLPEQGFVFASFNNSYKYTPETFGVWMGLLHAVSDSVLWIAKPNEAASRNLKREAEARGIPGERIVLAPFAANPDEHLARLRVADLFLDTLPYNAHSTACDALWAGLPVLTCAGSTFAGRVGKSVLNAIGLEELVTTSLADYEARALELARDPALLAGLRRKLANHRLSHPLFDTALYTRNLESLYRNMWQREQEGRAPAVIPLSYCVSTA